MGSTSWVKIQRLYLGKIGWHSGSDHRKVACQGVRTYVFFNIRSRATFYSLVFSCNALWYFIGIVNSSKLLVLMHSLVLSWVRLKSTSLHHWYWHRTRHWSVLHPILCSNSSSLRSLPGHGLGRQSAMQTSSPHPSQLWISPSHQTPSALFLNQYFTF